MGKKLSAHISMKEAVFSKTAERRIIDNTPNDDQLEVMKLTAEMIFEPVREHFGVPIGITSFFRSKELNEALRGSATSSHCKGEAIDIDADVFGKITNKEIFMYIWENLEFDQLIWEFGDADNPAWVHVSFRKGNNRKQIKKAVKVKQQGGYIAKYITYENSKA